jgi:hypothetical protein
VNTERVGNWIQILGNLGLIAGLVLVAVQIQQNTSATEAQMLSEAIAARNEFQMAIVGEDAAEALLIVLKNLQMANFMHRVRNELMTELGYSEPIDSRDSYATVYEYLGNSFGMAWWQGTNVDGGLWKDAAPHHAYEIEKTLTLLGDNHHLHDKSELEALRSRIETLSE